jgi:cell division GTPase FtsZ
MLRWEMKLVVVGFGQCGCNIADAFYAINSYAKSIFNRRIEILTDVFAVNTDEADLGGFRHIPKDKGHRILIGAMKTFGHGVGKINVDAVQIIKDSHAVVTDTVLRSKKFHEADAIMTIASGGGGTGSGTIGWAMKELKERTDKPVYGLIVLPFGFEEQGDTSYAAMNTAICINTVTQYADAVFLVDNERFRKAESSLSENLKYINTETVQNFYDLWCAGEERNPKYVGSKVLDGGDIKQSLDGITSVGRGQVDLSTFSRWKRADFREGVRERSAANGAVRQAENNLSLGINMDDVRKTLALISGPKGVLNIAMLEEISGFLQERTPKAVIRIGDYPRRAQDISVTVVASQLTQVDRLTGIFNKAEELFAKQKAINEETETKLKKLKKVGKNLPRLA